MTETAYLGLGSNLGNKLQNCLKAIDEIGALPGCTLLARSDFFQTEPVGVQQQDWYVNGVISLNTELTARQLLKSALGIEVQMGRVRERRWDSRIIDLDLLLYGESVIEEEPLVVPHPHMHLRRFVLEPLVQLAPNLVHPVLRRTMAQLLENCPKEGQSVIRMKEA